MKNHKNNWGPYGFFPYSLSRIEVEGGLKGEREQKYAVPGICMYIYYLYLNCQ
jgi:hypothetical protein